MDKYIQIKTSVDILDQSGSQISGAEKRFADWLLEVLEEGWLRENESLSGFSLITRQHIVVEALNSKPRGLSAFRKNSTPQGPELDDTCPCGWEYSQKDGSHYARSNALRTHKSRCKLKD
jgi:hypothetical protein